MSTKNRSQRVGESVRMRTTVRMRIAIATSAGLFLTLVFAGLDQPARAAETLPGVSGESPARVEVADVSERTVPAEGAEHAPVRANGASLPRSPGGRKTGAASARSAAAAKTEARKPAPILYVPPSRGHAWHSAGAGTRGFKPGGDSGSASSAKGASAALASTRPQVAVLAPGDHVGRSGMQSPTLYWILSTPTTIPIELTLVDDEAIEPLVRLRLPGPTVAGVHAVDLEALGVALPPDKIHRWFVALVHDPLRRSRDELAEGAIVFVDRATTSSSAAERTPSALRAEALRLAEQGLWYDALDALSTAIELAPDDVALAADRRALLDQAKLELALP